MRANGACPYERIEDPVRPFRIWDAKEKIHVRGRQYSSEINALNSGLIMARWAKVGQSFEVYDVRTGRLLGQYTRKPTGITFMRG